MANFLKQSTTKTLRLGPALDITDGVTEETGLSPAVEISKDGGAFAARNSATAITHDSNGWYAVELNATDTNTLGSLQVKFDDAAIHLPVWHEFTVLPANVYDSIIAGSDTLQVDLTQIEGVGQSATDLKDFADAGYDPTVNKIEGVKLTDTSTDLTNLPTIPANWLTAAGIAASALNGKGDWNVGKTGYDLSTAGILAIWHQLNSAIVTAGSMGKLLKDEITSVRMATLTDWINGGRLDLLLDAVKLETDKIALTNAGAGVAGSVITKIDTVDTVVDGIQTDLSNPTDGLGALKALVDALNDISVAQVNAEVLDVLNVDTFTEPGQGAPGVTVSLVEKIGYIYKFMRNKIETTSTLISVYDDAGTTVDQKSTISDASGTSTRGEFVTGP